jgi:hypothetical protein
MLPYVLLLREATAAPPLYNDAFAVGSEVADSPKLMRRRHVAAPCTYSLSHRHMDGLCQMAQRLH